MFKSRSASQRPAPATAAPSIETLRRRARHRLIGASVLVLAGVIGFPLLFDTAPRPLSADVTIDIPARNASVPVPPPAPLPAPAPVQVPVAEALDEREEAVPPASPAPAPVAATPSMAEPAKPAAEPAKRPAPPPAKPAVADAPKPADGPKADTARGKAAEEAPVRVIVQVGAFAEAQRAREVRLKLERAGLKTYTHVAETPEGQRIRVRLGPFSSRAEAEKAAARVKALGLPAAILTL
jgi:DedD protein